MYQTTNKIKDIKAKPSILQSLGMQQEWELYQDRPYLYVSIKIPQTKKTGSLMGFFGQGKDLNNPTLTDKELITQAIKNKKF